MKYKFLFWEYLESANIGSEWATQLGIQFNTRTDHSERYAILNEWQAIQVKLMDPAVNLTPLE